MWYFHIVDGCVARIGQIFDSVIKHHQAMLLSMKRISQNSMYNTPLIYMHTCHPELCASVCLCTNTGKWLKVTGLYQGGPSCFSLCTVLFELLTIKMYVGFLKIINLFRLFYRLGVRLNVIVVKILRRKC